MSIQIILVRFFGTISLTILLTAVASGLWSCSENAKAIPVIPSQVEGVWYEIARLPSSDVPACLKVIAPKSQVNGSYMLHLDYINNVNNGWKPTKESLIFPWNEAKNGIFNLQYTDGVVNMNIKFKYLGSSRGYAVVCGYTNYAYGLNIIRILSRNRLVNSTFKAEVNALASQLHINLNELTWVQQEGRCNGSERLSVLKRYVFAILFFFRMVLKNTPLSS